MIEKKKKATIIEGSAIGNLAKRSVKAGSPLTFERTVYSQRN